MLPKRADLTATPSPKRSPMNSFHFSATSSTTEPLLINELKQATFAAIKNGNLTEVKLLLGAAEVDITQPDSLQQYLKKTVDLKNFVNALVHHETKGYYREVLNELYNKVLKQQSEFLNVFLDQLNVLLYTPNVVSSPETILYSESNSIGSDTESDDSLAPATDAPNLQETCNQLDRALTTSFNEFTQSISDELLLVKLNNLLMEMKISFNDQLNEIIYYDYGDHYQDCLPLIWHAKLSQWSKELTVQDSVTSPDNPTSDKAALLAPAQTRLLHNYLAREERRGCLPSFAPKRSAFFSNVDSETQRAIIYARVPIDSRDEKGNTLLHQALVARQLIIFDFLLFLKANPFIVNNNGLDVMAFIKVHLHATLFFGQRAVNLLIASYQRMPTMRDTVPLPQDQLHSPLSKAQIKKVFQRDSMEDLLVPNMGVPVALEAYGDSLKAYAGIYLGRRIRYRTEREEQLHELMIAWQAAVDLKNPDILVVTIQAQQFTTGLYQRSQLHQPLRRLAQGVQIVPENNNAMKLTRDTWQLGLAEKNNAKAAHDWYKQLRLYHVIDDQFPISLLPPTLAKTTSLAAMATDENIYSNSVQEGWFNYSVGLRNDE